MRWQEFRIGNIIAATNGPRTGGPHFVTLVGLEGWDTPPEIRRNTVPRLFGHGDIVSRLGTFSGKEVSVLISANMGDDSPRILRTALNRIATRINETSTLEMLYFENGKLTFRETVKALPAPVFYDEWSPDGAGEIRMQVNFYLPDPLKTVYLNGRSTPEAERRI